MTNHYEEKKQRLIDQLRSYTGNGIKIAKSTSNLFRHRKNDSTWKLEVSDFNHVLEVNSDEMWAEIEGMATYEEIVNATLRRGLAPTVVPQLKSITIGGAISGVGIESSSFKHGLVHESVIDMEVLLADGRVIMCTPHNEHKDLFFSFPNSYGTLGYVLKLKVKLVPVKDYVRLTHTRYTDPSVYFKALREACDQNIDFLDGTIFSRDEMYITIGDFIDDAPYSSDYTYENIYYQSIRRRETDYLTTLDYLWRWDTDWFWCSKNLFVQNSFVRALVGKHRLNSTTYTKVMRWNNRWQFSRRLNRIIGVHSESVIQDVDVPVEHALAFLEFFQKEIGISPIWICPIRTFNESTRFDLYPMDPNRIYVNFGFWDAVKSRKKLPDGYYNRKIETKVAELGGIKSLYSDSHFPSEEFWQTYNGRAYKTVKAKYDPQTRFKDIYQKCVLKQ